MKDILYILSYCTVKYNCWGSVVWVNKLVVYSEHWFFYRKEKFLHYLHGSLGYPDEATIII